MSAKIFISFASQDRGVAMTLCSALEGRGFKCWISARDILPGENFQIAIVRAIREAKIMLLVFTANSNNSEEMSKELALASQNKLMVVPLRVEDVTPNDAFSYEFATRQWIDLFSDWEFAIHQLAQRLENAMRSMDAGADLNLAHEALPPAISQAPPAASSKRASRSSQTTEPATLAPEVLSEPQPLTSSDHETDPATEAMIASSAARSPRTGLLVAVALVVVIAAGAGVTALRWLHSDSKHPDSRAMVMLPTTTPASTPVAGPPQAAAAATVQPAASSVDADAQALADKPQPRKHKAAVTKPDDQEVPF